MDKGLGDEENRARILNRLSEPAFVSLTARLGLASDINTYNLMTLPVEGVSISAASGKNLILSIAERDPTYFDLAATPFSVKNGLGAYIPDSVMYSKPRNNSGLSHSGTVVLSAAKIDFSPASR